jgi:transcriptional regulator with XRE-family HTH domain
MKGDAVIFTDTGNSETNGCVRRERIAQGVSMKELADRMGVRVQAISSLEIHDQRGTIKVETRERALAALGKRSVTVLVNAGTEQRSDATYFDALVDGVLAGMGAHAQTYSREAVETLVRSALVIELAMR